MTAILAQPVHWVKMFTSGLFGNRTTEGFTHPCIVPTRRFGMPTVVRTGGPKCRQGDMNRIKEIRDALGVSQNELARRLNTSHRQIAYLETGERRLTLGWMGRIASALGVAPQDLITEPVATALQDEVQQIPPSAMGAVGEALEAKHLFLYRVIKDSVQGYGINVGDTLTVEQSDAAITTMKPGDVALVALRGKKEPDEDARLCLRIFVPPHLFVPYRLGQNLCVRRDDASVSLNVVGVVVRKGH